MNTSGEANNGVGWVGALLLFGVWLCIFSVSPPIGLALAVLVLVMAWVL